MRALLLAVSALLACLWLAACRGAPDDSVTLRGQRFAVEVADTDAARRQGLMYRNHLDAGHGMLFIYPRSETFWFWMMNTRISLDILFFDERGRLLDVFLEAPPCKTEPCARYKSSLPAKYALELPAGTARNLGVIPGDLLVIEPRP